jgi:hypothetical protein
LAIVERTRTLATCDETTKALFVFAASVARASLTGEQTYGIVPPQTVKQLYTAVGGREGDYGSWLCRLESLKLLTILPSSDKSGLDGGVCVVGLSKLLIAICGALRENGVVLNGLVSIEHMKITIGSLFHGAQMSDYAFLQLLTKLEIVTTSPLPVGEEKKGGPERLLFCPMLLSYPSPSAQELLWPALPPAVYQSGDRLHFTVIGRHLISGRIPASFFDSLTALLLEKYPPGHVLASPEVVFVRSPTFQSTALLKWDRGRQGFFVVVRGYKPAVFLDEIVGSITQTRTTSVTTLVLHSNAMCPRCLWNSGVCWASGALDLDLSRVYTFSIPDDGAQREPAFCRSCGGKVSVDQAQSGSNGADHPHEEYRARFEGSCSIGDAYVDEKASKTGGEVFEKENEVEVMVSGPVTGHDRDIVSAVSFILASLDSNYSFFRSRVFNEDLLFDKWRDFSSHSERNVERANALKSCKVFFIVVTDVSFDMSISRLQFLQVKAIIDRLNTSPSGVVVIALFCGGHISQRCLVDGGEVGAFLLSNRVTRICLSVPERTDAVCQSIPAVLRALKVEEKDIPGRQYLEDTVPPSSYPHMRRPIGRTFGGISGDVEIDRPDPGELLVSYRRS